MSDAVHEKLSGELCRIIDALLAFTPEDVAGQIVAALEEALHPAAYPNRDKLPPRLLFQVVEQAPVAISVTDAEANILYANAAFSEVTGYPRGEVLGQNESLLSDRSTPREIYRQLWETIRGGGVWSGELVNRRRDGERYVADLVITPVPGEGGEVSHYLGMHRDVTEVRWLERQVRNQKAQFESVVESAPVVMVLLDERRRVVRGNRMYAALKAELGREPAPYLLERLGAAADGEFKDVELELGPGRPGGEPCWLKCSGVRFFEEDASAESYFEQGRREYLLLVAADVSDLKQRERELRTSALRALTAEQELVQSLREAMGGAMHQLEGPMNLLYAAINMVARRASSWEGGPQVLEVLREAEREGRSALSRLRNSMPVEVREPPGPVELDRVLRDVLSLFTGRMLRSGVTVDWSPGEIPPIRGREGALRSLLKQLVENALDALDELDGEPRELTLATRHDRDGVEITVADNGPGVPDALRLKIFEPFFSTRSPRGRAGGMGLAVAQEVVNDHAGTLTLDSGSGRGACFKVRLPLGRPGEEP